MKFWMVYWIAFGADVFFGVWVLVKNPRSKTHQLFSIMAGVIAFWSIGKFFLPLQIITGAVVLNMVLLGFIADLLFFFEKKTQEADVESKYLSQKLDETEGKLAQMEKLRTMEELAASIAHRIRNPLATINSTAQFCLTNFKLEGEIKKYIEIILRHSDEIEKTIKELIDFTHLSPIYFQPFLLNEVLDQVCMTVKTRCTNQKVRLIKKYPSTLPQAMISRCHLEEAFLNILSNSLEAMPNGGTIFVSAEIDPSKEFVIIRFVDTGKGIPHNMFPNIFNPFFTTKPDGMGMGLTIAHKIIESLKGKITLESKEGEGTTVTVFVPIEVNKTST